MAGIIIRERLIDRKCKVLFNYSKEWAMMDWHNLKDSVLIISNGCRLYLVV